MIAKLSLCVLALLLGDPQAKEEKPQPKAEQKIEQKTEPKKDEQKAEPKADKQKTDAVAPVADKPADKAADKPAESEEKEINGVKLAAIEVNMVSYTNQERLRYGLPPLEVDKELMETAREQAEWMTRNRSMVHTRRPLAENIAMGQPDSSNVVRAWMNSPGHRANILNSGHRRIGVAAFRTDSGTIYWCQQFKN
jgi:uncharacterized protein YkwD